MSISSESIDQDVTTDHDQQEPSVEQRLLLAFAQLGRQQMNLPTSSDGFELLYDIDHLLLSPTEIRVKEELHQTKEKLKNTKELDGKTFEVQMEERGEKLELENKALRAELEHQKVLIAHMALHQKEQQLNIVDLQKTVETMRETKRANADDGRHGTGGAGAGSDDQGFSGCYVCGSKQHRAANCKVGSSCAACGQREHDSKSCVLLDEWVAWQCRGFDATQIGLIRTRLHTENPICFCCFGSHKVTSCRAQEASVFFRRVRGRERNALRKWWIDGESGSSMPYCAVGTARKEASATSPYFRPVGKDDTGRVRRKAQKVPPTKLRGDGSE